MIDTSVFNSAANQIGQIQGIAQANSAASAQQAAIQRNWTAQQAAQATATNIAEAAKNRDWQEYMSNTAHQREVADLRAAGLNPVLSAMNGNGAAVTSGATASAVMGQGTKGDVDESANGAIANLLGSILSADKAIEAANINARTQEAVADKYTAMENIVANISADASRYSADSARYASMYGSDQALKGSYANAAATKYSAEQHAEATKYSADKSASATRYAAGRSYAASRYATNTSASTSKYVANTNSAASRYAADLAFDAKNISSGASAASSIASAAIAAGLFSLARGGGHPIGFAG